MAGHYLDLDAVVTELIEPCTLGSIMYRCFDCVYSCVVASYNNSFIQLASIYHFLSLVSLSQVSFLCKC